MHNHVLERGKLPLYGNFYKESPPNRLSTFFYAFLRVFEKPVESPISGEEYIPIKMLVTIRTDRTNEVIVPDDGKFYTDCTSEYPDIHPLDDRALLAAKSMVLKYFVDSDFTKVIPGTVPLPVGACYRDGVIYVYVTLIVDHKMKSWDCFKLKDCHYEKISDLIVTDDLEAELVGSLVPVNMQSEEVDSNV